VNNQAQAAAARLTIDNRIFDPTQPEFVRQPMAAWQMLLRDYPAAYHSDLHMWFINSYALCADILKNPAFTPNWTVWEFAPPPDPNAEKLDFDRMVERSLHTIDAASHLRLRKLTLPAFSRKVMQQIDDKIRDLVCATFDEIGTPATFDVYSELAVKLPARSIARMVGVPLDAEDLFDKGLARNITLATRANLSEAERQQAKRDTGPGFAYLRALLAERRARTDPGDDFIGTLIKTDDNGDRLDDWDIISLISALITAGADTAIDLHTYAIAELLNHPEQYQMLLRRPELMESAIHEILRHGAPGKFPLFRYALEDTVFGGQLIRKGEACVVNLSTAWNDPQQCPQPERFDITRPLEGNIIFGAGPHFCIGTYLVRVQGSLTIREFARRFPDASLTGEIDYDYGHHNARRINRLMVNTNIG
jgi:cytochrome P450